MAIRDVFSRRQRRERGEMPDVYQYAEIPRPFRVQVLHIVSDVLGEDKQYGGGNYVEVVYRWTTEAILRQHGLLSLTDRNYGYCANLTEFFLGKASTEQAMDIIETLFQGIESIVNTSEYRNATEYRHLKPDEAIVDLNARFRESGIGYQYEAGMIIRLDSEFLHAEAVRPALAVLRDARFTGANEEFLKAHEHYRHGRFEECLVECCKAFESTMKSICTTRNWTFNSTDTAKALVKVCLDNGLVPSYLDNQIISLRTLFESGIPTVRNKMAGHGQGVQQRKVPEFLARYVLNQTATTILFLVESDAETATV